MQFREHVKVRQEKFGAVVFETLSEKVFVTNETGAEILRLIESGKEIEEIVEELIKNYDSDPATIRYQTEEFIRSLKEKGIINSGGGKC